MKKILLRRFGGPEVLELIDAPDPAVRENEVLIDIKAVGLNWSEIMIRRGEFPVETGDGFTLGAEGAGIVEAVGSAVRNIKPGDRVANFEIMAYHIPGQGNYAEKIAVDAGKVLRIPDRMAFKEAAALPMALLTAYDAMINHEPLPDEGNVVITASSGSVGIAAIQIAKRRGLNVIAVTRDKAKESRIAALGAKVVVESDPPKLREKVLALTGDDGLDYVFDAVSGETATQLLTLMAENSAFVIYGLLSDSRFTVPPQVMFNQVVVRGYVVLKNLLDTRELQRVWADILPLAETREVVIPVHKTFPFEQAAAAHREMEEHKHFGKIVLTRE